MNSPDQTPRARVFEMLMAFDTTMMVTHTPSGPLDCRPMHIAQIDPSGRVWFITSNQGHAALQVKQNPDVLLVMQAEQRYLTIMGRAQVVAEREQLARLWKEPYRVWFPQGVDDPDAVLIAVNPNYAEYWDNAGVNNLRYIFQAAKAYATGERPEVEDETQHGRTQL